VIGAHYKIEHQISFLSRQHLHSSLKQRKNVTNMFDSMNALKGRIHSIDLLRAHIRRRERLYLDSERPPVHVLVTDDFAIIRWTAEACLVYTAKRPILGGYGQRITMLHRSIRYNTIISAFCMSGPFNSDRNGLFLSCFCIPHGVRIDWVIKYRLVERKTRKNRRL
jgi:hypothetical protein